MTYIRPVLTSLLTAIFIIFSTWLYNYQFYQKGRHAQKAEPVQGASQK